VLFYFFIYYVHARSVVRYLKLNHDNDTVSGIAILDTTAIPEVHMKRQSKVTIKIDVSLLVQ